MINRLKESAVLYSWVQGRNREGYWDIGQSTGVEEGRKG